MSIVIRPEEIKEFDVDSMAIRVFLKALEIVGGPRKLIEYRNLTWIVSLMEASYAIVLAEEAFKTEDEIAQFLAISRSTVRNILRAEPELVLKRLEGELRERSPKTHIAGGLAKLAYQEIKWGRDSLVFFSAALKEGASILGVGWPAEVLARIKGLKWPADPKEVAERLRGLAVNGKDPSSLIEEEEKPIPHPKDLLKLLSQKLKEN